jgi:outer membrane protein assembly factor BamE (lipoprotein component of BamABCDE complex)
MKQTVILLLIFLLSCGNNSKLEKFDQEKWKDGTQIERGNMSTDLVESKILIGKTKSEVLEYLGYPKDSAKTNFHYLVDFGYMTPFHLDVNFDLTDSRVKEVTLTD